MGVQTSRSLRGHNSAHCTLYGIMLKKSISCSGSQNLEHLDSATMAALNHPFSYLGRTVLAIISRWLRESLPSPLGILTSVGLLFFTLKNILFYFWLCCIFVAAHRFPLVAVRGATLWLQCLGFALWWLLLLPSTYSRVCGLH